MEGRHHSVTGLVDTSTSRGQPMVLRWLAVWSVGLFMVLTVTSCTAGSAGDISRTGDGSSQAITSTQPFDAASSARLASSLTDLFQKTLDQGANNAMGLTDLEQQVLERAVGTGAISAADYERVFAVFTGCMSQQGVNVTWQKESDGVYYPPLIDYQVVSFTSAQWSSANSTCQPNVYAVQQLYMVQQANPDLLADPSQAVVACLRRNGLVDASYTSQDFDNDWAYTGAEPPFPFDPFDPAAHACLMAEGFTWYAAPS